MTEPASGIKYGFCEGTEKFKLKILFLYLKNLIFSPYYKMSNI